MDSIIKMFGQQIYELKKLWKNKRSLTRQLLTLAMVLSTALMIWKGFMAYTISESPVVVVLSGSMEPAFQRGDILFLDNNKELAEVGDIVVFKIKGRDIPIVHRVLKVHRRRRDKNAFYLTKGDNNNIDDRGLYAPGQLYLQRDDIVGTMTGSVPYAGMVTIIMNDYPALKILLIGTMGILVLTQRE